MHRKRRSLSNKYKSLIYKTLLFLSLSLYSSPPHLAIQTLSPEDINSANSNQTNLIIQQKNQLQQQKTISHYPLHRHPKNDFSYTIPSLNVTTTKKSPKFFIIDIQLNGSHSLSRFKERAILKEFLFTDMSLADINTLVRKLTKTYFDSGFITTRVKIPPQTLKDGSLRLEIQEGQMGKILSNDFTPRQLSLVFPGLSGKPLNIHQLERGLKQLNRLSSNQVKLRLVPSPHTPNETLVLLENTPSKKAKGVLYYSTASNPEIHPIPHSLIVTLDDTLNLNESLSLTYSQRFKDKQQYHRSFSSAFSIPFDSFLWKSTYSHFDYLVILNGINRNFTSSGLSKSIGHELSFPLYSKRHTSLTLLGGWEHERHESFVEDVQSTVGKYSSNYLTYGLEYNIPVKGLLTLHSTFFYPTSEAYSDFLKTNLQWESPEISSKTTLQFTQGELLNSKRISLADYGSVKGYDSPALGDIGIHNTSKLRFNLGHNLIFNALAEGGWVRKKGGRNYHGLTGKAFASSLSFGLAYIRQSLNIELMISKAIAYSHHLRPPRYKLYLNVLKYVF